MTKGILLTLILVLYLGSIGSHWLPSPDSALYLMLGENLAEGNGYTLWGEAFYEVPPGYPAQVALLHLLGFGSLYWQNSHLVLLAIIALICVYGCLRSWTTEWKAILSAVLLAGSFNMHHNTVRLLTDVPCMTLFWAGVLLSLKGRQGSRNLTAAGMLLLVGACLMRVPGILLTLGAVTGFVWEKQCITGKSLPRRQQIILLLAGCYLYMAGEFAISYSSDQPLSASLLWQPVQHAWQSGEELSLAFLGQSMPVTAAWGVFGVPCALGAVISWRRRQRVGLSILACYLLGIWLLRPLLARYFLPVMPILFWFYLEGMQQLLARFIAQWDKFFTNQSLLRWRLTSGQTMLLFAIVVLGINLPKTLRSAYRVHNPTSLSGYEEQSELIEVADFLRERLAPGDRFMSNTDQRMLSYLSEMDSIGISDQDYKGRPLNAADIRLWRELGTNYFISGLIKSKDHHDRSETAFWQASLRPNSSDPPLICVFSNDSYKVYTSTPRLHAESLLQSQLLPAAKLLKEVAQPSDRLAVSHAGQQLAYMSGIQSCSDHQSEIDLLSEADSLQDEGATLFVLLKNSSSKEYWDQVRAMRRVPGFIGAHISSHFALFSSRAEVARQLETDPEIRALFELLLPHRQPSDLMAGRGYLGRVSQLSEIPLIPDRSLSQIRKKDFELTDELLQKWLDLGAKWIVIRLGKDQDHQHYWASVHAARRHPQLTEKSLGDYCKVFSTRAIKSPENVAQRSENSNAK